MTSRLQALPPDLQVLAGELVPRVIAVEELTTLVSGNSSRCSYLLTLENGERLKGRVLPDATRARRFNDYSAYLDKSVFPSIVASHGTAVLEQWIAADSTSSLSLQKKSARAGQILGRLHQCDLEGSVCSRTFRSLKSRHKKLQEALTFLQNCNELTAQECRQLDWIASQNAPAYSQAGLVHLDFCDENMVVSGGDLYVVDNELLDVGILDADLARTWLRWPDLDRTTFLNAYSEFRSPKGFLHHQSFWAVYTSALSLEYRIGAGVDSSELSERLRLLSKGQPHAPWRNYSTPNNQHPRIVVGFCCDYLAIGGQEQMCLNMVQSLDRTLFEPRVYTFRGGEIADEIERLGIPIHRASSVDPLSWRVRWTEEDAQELTNFRQDLPKLLRRDGVSAAIVFSLPGAVEAARAAGVTACIEKLDGPRMLDKISDKSAFDYVVAESRTIEALIKSRSVEFGISAQQVKWVPPGVGLEDFSRERVDALALRRKLGLDEDDILIGFVGRLASEKNLSNLITAFSAVSPPVGDREPTLFIAGPDHGERAQLESLIENLDVGQRVILFEEPDNVPETMAGFDVFAMSSVSEGMPTTILEAMSLGLPIVATNVGSIGEAVVGNGILVAPGDAAAMTSALQRMVDEPQLRATFSRKSEELSRRYSLRENVIEYEALILQVLGIESQFRTADSKTH